MRRFAGNGGSRRVIRAGGRDGSGTGSGGSGAPATPATILGSLLHADFDAADPGIVLNAGNVASIPNRGGDSAAMVQATAASQPAWSATSFAGGPGMTFDGADDSMACALASAVPVGRRPYMWVVFKANNTTAANQIVAALYGNIANEPYFVVWSNRTGAPSKFSNGMKPNAAGSADAGTFLTNTETANTHLSEVGDTVNGTAGYVLDGAPTDVTGGGTVAVVTAQTLVELRAGAYGVAPSAQFSGCTIRRIIVANNLPSAAQLTAMRAYLRSQPYGLTF